MKKKDNKELNKKNKELESKINPNELGESTEEKEYDFISEDVVTTPKQVVKGSKLRMVALVLCLAVFFGILASISYAISNGIWEYIARKNNEAGRKDISLTDEDKTVTSHTIVTDVSELTDKVKGGVVNIRAIVESGDGLFSNPIISTEEYSGIVFADDGSNYYILTQYSSISEATELNVYFEGGAVTGGSIIGYDKTLDLAVLLVAHSSYYMQDFSKVRVLEFADEDSVVKGSAVLAIGAPNGIVGSIDYGIITSDNNPYPMADICLKLSTINIHYYEKAAGAVVNMEGKICGISTNVYSDREIPAFISTDNLRVLLEHLANEGELLYTGAVCENVTQDVLGAAGCENGIYVKKVEEGSPADKAGLRNGDIIISCNDKEIIEVDDYTTMIYETGFDEEIKLKVVRNGDNREIKLTIGK